MSEVLLKLSEVLVLSKTYIAILSLIFTDRVTKLTQNEKERCFATLFF